MPHIHKDFDFVVVPFIVYDNKVLLIHHKELKKWLSAGGGHIELNEDPEQALEREIKEETGLDVEVVAEKPNFKVEGRKFLFPPTYLDVHPINETHRHIGMVYFCKASSDDVKLATKEHHEIKWFTEEDLEKSEYNLQEDIKFYAREAFKRAG
ncbi:MAG: NUDIX domain-containing protein [Candidatus Niyogibacteria bacterium]|nr:NUDIX domain-containing protein [Candidatus Niyogibacteria bacterium]